MKGTFIYLRQEMDRNKVIGVSWTKRSISRNNNRSAKYGCGVGENNYRGITLARRRTGRRSGITNATMRVNAVGLIWSDWDSRAEEAASKSDIARLGRNLDQQLQQQQDEDDDDESPSGMMVLREED